LRTVYTDLKNLKEAADRVQSNFYTMPGIELLAECKSGAVELVSQGMLGDIFDKAHIFSSDRLTANISVR